MTIGEAVGARDLDRHDAAIVRMGQIVAHRRVSWRQPTTDTGRAVPRGLAAVEFTVPHGETRLAAGARERRDIG